MLSVEVLTEQSGEFHFLYVPRRDPADRHVKWNQSSIAGKYHFFSDTTEIDIMAAAHRNDGMIGLGSRGYLMDAAWRCDATFTMVDSDDAGNGSGPDRFVSFVANCDYAWTWQGIKNRAECLHEQWGENLGVEITWEVMDFTQFMESVDRAPVHIIQTVWMPDYPDPDSVLRASPIRRRTHWRNEAFDRLVEEARQVLDQEERLGLYTQADRILVEEQAVVIPLTYMWSHMLVKPWVRKLPTSAINEWLWKVFVIEALE